MQLYILIVIIIMLYIVDWIEKMVQIIYTSCIMQG